MANGFSITNVDIVGNNPCCDLKLEVDDNEIFSKEKMTFQEVKELMASMQINCASIVRQLDSFRNKK